MDAIAFERPEWAFPALILWLVIVVATFISYYRSNLSPPQWLLGFFLRGAGTGLILICLLEPSIITSRPKPQANIFSVVVDHSQSMSTGKGNKDASTPHPLTAVLGDQVNWLTNLQDSFRVRKYLFDTTLQPVDSFEGLTWDGNLSTFFESMTTLQQRYKGRPIAGIILFTDGRATDGESPSTNPTIDWRQFGCPIYPVRLPSPPSMRDLRIASLSLRQSDFEAAPVTITATLNSNGLAGKDAIVELLDRKGKRIQSQTIQLTDKPGGILTEFRFRPEESGVQGYQIRSRLTQEAVPSDAQETQSTSLELTLGNNSRFQVVDRGRGPYRILYVAGRPNWEHKFLKRALEEDAEIRLASLLRIAKKEPKFSFRDNKVDSSNPLFSGFEGISEEEKEQYNEPVFVRLGDVQPDQLKGGFPKSADELFDFQAVIIDDLETDFFQQEQQLLLRRFVTERGGGLLVLGGQESMRGAGFRDSIISQLLPIYGEEGEGSEATIPFRMNLTREGWQQPFLRTAETEAEERTRRDKMPPFEVLNRTADIKPGASVLAEASTEQGKQPALVWQRFGKGKTAAFLIGDMWRWGMHNEDTKHSPLQQSWRQMVRWLIADVPKRFSMNVENVSTNGRAKKLVVEARQVDFEPMDNATVQLSIQKPSGEVLEVMAEPSPERRGFYETTVVHDAEGVYATEAKITSPDGQDIGYAQTGWIYEPSILEFQEVGFHESLLQRIAQETGGEVIPLEGLERFVQTLPTRSVPIAERKSLPLWHQGWVVLIAVSCLSAEWGMRRWKGLA